MMQAVLDTNFWLATHVTCVTIGYTATFVAGVLGIVYIMRGVVTPSLDPTIGEGSGADDLRRHLLRHAVELHRHGAGRHLGRSIVGPLLGLGSQGERRPADRHLERADLHARWGGMVKQRGMAVLAVVGNMVTGWSWFGTNQLRVGLHSYGFSNTLAVGLVIGWASMRACSSWVCCRCAGGAVTICC